MRDRPGKPRGGSRPRAGAARGTARPAPRRAGGVGPGTTRTADRSLRGRFTGRTAVLTVVLVALGLSFVFPLRVYLAQQAEISQLRQAQAAQREHIATLQAEATLWADDDYLRIQARKRLYFGEPDELLLVISDVSEPPQTGFDPDAVPPPPGTWWDTLWASVRSADAAAGADGAGVEEPSRQQAGAETTP